MIVKAADPGSTGVIQNGDIICIRHKSMKTVRYLNV